jgi:hypothetical protein
MTSQLNVDTIVDKAGSGGSNVKMANTSTYVSDGGGATQNTVQGLAKAWGDVSGSGTPAVDDSLNIASVTDVGSGNRKYTTTNALSNTNYVVLSGMVADGNTNGNRGASGQHIYSKATTNFAYYCYMGSTGSGDGGLSDSFSTDGFAVNGDLA